MAVHDLFSKRQKRLRGEYPEVYQYDELSLPFRTQVVYILQDVLGRSYSDRDTDEWFRRIHKILATEYGVFQLHERGRSKQEVVFNFLLDTNTSVEQTLDVIELSLRAAYSAHPTISYGSPNIVLTPDKAVNALNIRFREHGIGYQFESGQVVRVDSGFLHQEAVKPALQVLRAPHFSGAETEFQSAHEHYRHQRFQEAINECLKALESTLKVICQKRGWPFQDKDTASTLIRTISGHNLVPQYLQTHLESGVPAIRNRESGHGSGTTPRQVDEHLAAYVLHLTASTIVFLAEAERVK